MSVTRILHAPAALPHPTWLRDQLVWADNLSAIWPGAPTYEDPFPEPRALTESQQQTLSDIRTIRTQVPELNLFEPIYLDGREELIAEATNRFTRLRPKASAPLARSDVPIVQELLAPSLGDVSSDWLDDSDAAEYLHDRKLPAATTDKLIRAGVLQQTNDGIGYRSREAGQVEALLTRIGGAVALRDDWTLAADTSNTAAELLEAASRRTKHLAVATRLPALPAIRADIDIRHLVDLRTSIKFPQMRDDFIGHLTHVLNSSTRFVEDLEESKNELEIRMRVEEEYKRRLSLEVLSAKQPLRTWLKTENFATFSVNVGMTFISRMDNLTEVNLPNIVSASAELGLALSEILYCRAGSDPFLRHMRSVLK